MTLDELKIASAALARFAPRQWEEWLDKFKQYVDARKDSCVSAAVQDLQVAQGKAQEAKLLLDLFANAVQAADRIEQRRK